MRKLPRVRVAAAILTFLVFVIPIAGTLALPPPGLNPLPPQYSVLSWGAWNDMSPSWSPDGKTLAFVSDRNQAWGVYVMKSGSALDQELSPAGAVSTSPSWSPDSSALAFWSRTGGRTDVMVASMKNSTVLAVTTGEYSVLQGTPKWSPDGSSLLFLIESGGTQLVSLDLSSKGLKVVALVSGDGVSATWISREEVVYSSLVGGNYSIFRASIDGGGGTRILSGGGNYTSPVALGSRLAYISNLIVPNLVEGGIPPWPTLPGDSLMWTSNLDGSNRTFQYGMVSTKAEGTGLRTWPYTPGIIGPLQVLAWSPDGREIAYIAEGSLYGPCLYFWDVASGTASVGPYGLLNSNSTQPSWNPDGVNLVFAAQSGGYYHIYSLNTTAVHFAMPTGDLYV